MKVNLAYGQGWLPVEFPDGQTTVIEPSHTLGLADEKTAVLAALRSPIGAKALRELVGPTTKICILFTDITRATFPLPSITSIESEVGSTNIVESPLYEMSPPNLPL